MEEAKNLKLVNVAENLLYLLKDNLGTLIVTGKGNAFNGHKIVYCNLILNVNEEEEEEKPKQLPVQNVDIVTTVIPRGKAVQHKISISRLHSRWGPDTGKQSKISSSRLHSRWGPDTGKQSSNGLY